MKEENKHKMRQDIKFVTAIFFGILLNLGFVFAQSSSPSYQAVDFVNPAASLSPSGSYKLNDSIDYYGGIHDSASYHECTGDFAVLSNCGAVVVPPPPPPPPPVIPPVVTEPPIIPAEPEPPVVVTPKVVVPVVRAPIAPIVRKPVVVNTEKIVIKIPEVVIEVRKPEVKGSASEVICEDLTCSQADLLRGSAPTLLSAKKAEACSIYVYGGFEVNSPCDVSVFVWVLLALSSLFVLPIGVAKFVLVKNVKVKRRRKN